MPYQTVHFEKDPQTADRLRESLATNINRERSSVITGASRPGLAAWLAANGYQEYRNGLVYSDPIGDPIPCRALNAGRPLPAACRPARLRDRQ